MSKTRIILEVDPLTAETNVQADNVPDGQVGLLLLMRALVAAQCVICDQMEERRLFVSRPFAPVLSRR